MKKSRIFAIVFPILLSVNYLTAQTLEQVLESHFKAVGQEKLIEKQTFSIKAAVQQMGMEIPMEMKVKRPNKFRMEMELQGKKMVQTFDGEKGQMVVPWVSSEPQDLSGAELDQAMEQANIDGELYNYKEKGFTATLLGKVNLDGAPAFNIRLTGKDGNAKNLYIDAKSFMLKKVKAKIEAQGQEFEIEQNFGEYKDFDGIMIASAIETVSPMGKATIVFKEVKFDEKFDESIFSKP